MKTIQFKKHNLFQKDIDDCLKQISYLLGSSLQGKYILDFGCNDGSKTLLFKRSLDSKRNFIIGADINYKHLRFAKDKIINCCQCNFEKLFLSKMSLSIS